MSATATPPTQQQEETALLAAFWDRAYWIPLNFVASTTSECAVGKNERQSDANIFNNGTDFAVAFPSSDPTEASISVVAVFWFLLLVANFTLPCWRNIPKTRTRMFAFCSFLRVFAEAYFFAHVLIAAGVAFDEERIISYDGGDSNNGKNTSFHVFSFSSILTIRISRGVFGFVFAVLAVIFGADSFIGFSRFTFSFIVTTIIGCFFVDAIQHGIATKQDNEHLSSFTRMIGSDRGAPSVLFASLAIGIACAASSVAKPHTAIILSTALIMSVTSLYWFMGLFCVVAKNAKSESFFPAAWYTLPSLCVGILVFFGILLKCFVYDLFQIDTRRQVVMSALQNKETLLAHLSDLVTHSDPMHVKEMFAAMERRAQREEEAGGARRYGVDDDEDGSVISGGGGRGDGDSSVVITGATLPPGAESMRSLASSPGSRRNLAQS